MYSVYIYLSKVNFSQIQNQSIHYYMIATITFPSRTTVKSKKSYTVLA